MFVHLEILEKNCHAMVVTQDAPLPLQLPALDNERLHHFVSLLSAAQHANKEEMSDIINKATATTAGWLRNTLLAPLLPVLEQAGTMPGDQLVFVPDGALSFLPLHAIPLSPTEVLGDRYEISYTPSLSILEQCVARDRPAPTRLFAVVNPLDDLFYTNLEATLVQQHFAEVNRVDRRKVTRAALLDGAADAHVFFYSGHAQFQMAVPLWSGMVVGRTGELEIVVEENGARVRKKRPAVSTPHDLVTVMDADTGLQMPHCTLAVLSGCQSGLA